MTVGTPDNLASSTRGGVGQSPRRPDGTRKVTGQFAYSSDLWHDDMLWGVTLRSPHPHARIRSIDIGAALATSGVYAVLTHEDVPGIKYYGLEENDQPVLAVDTVRYQGEAVALVAADHPETARRAMHEIVVNYEVLDPLTDPVRAALDPEAPALHEHGNVVRHQPVRVGDVPSARSRADVVVTGEYEIGMQDQAFLGPESGLAVPGEDGGVDLYVATQWMHTDLREIAPCLGLPEEKVRMTLSGVGGAFGAREDLSMQVHAAMLAMHTGRPIKIVYNREESFYGHVHRHPAKMRYEHGATADGRIVYATARIVLDGGAYASSTTNVVGNAASLGVGPYIVPNVEIDAYGVYTNNPPCGAMRGFGAVQACYAYESQMDKLARELELHPLDVRRINAIHQGAAIATGQVVDTPAPMREMIDRLRDAPLPEAVDSGDVRNLPGGVSNTTHGEGVRRGIGYGVGLKNICFSEGFDDYSTARVRLEVVGGEPAVLVHTAAAEVGQGLVTLQGQIARTELGVERVSIAPADTQVGDAGSSSASRQSYMTGGAVKRACEAVRDRLFQLAAERFDVPADQLSLSGGKLVSEHSGVLVALADLLGDEAIEETREFHHRPTTGMDPVTGQGDTHTQLALCIHRAVVDVDVELGLLKVVDLTAVQDVGTVLNRVSLEGQIHGGTAQGLGLAVMEEIQLADGKLANPSFTDYLIPTILDMPPMRLDILERADPNAPYGLRGAGEPSTLSSTPAIAAAIRDATGLQIDRVPVRPHDIVHPVTG
ncbi:xanthine dehydrogenase, molybdenum binding subunit apoprotein [Haloechinothrix alba]|uniref:Xanthine dehydrogenase, molybdenum binding subunit apoprotein n=1 Tax=Haloechinothrix alba TaxID=664784 RepID=A0A238Y1W1_9PSEU|nr:xanthine dehydrogenase subunit D [Haloechinothrix alba]SNR64289.1 xanthine dehydrogenase, molybdenum binding subunit apoprotein [Haloechinothrix alba]